MKKEKKKESRRSTSENEVSRNDQDTEERWRHSGERQYEKGVVDEESETRLEIGSFEKKKESR